MRQGGEAASTDEHRTAFLGSRLLLLLLGALTTTTGCGAGVADNANRARGHDRTIAAPASAQARRKHEAEPEVGRCHGDSCSWSIVHGRSVVAQQGGEVLLRLLLLGGTSANTEGDPQKARIRWHTARHEVYVFCSKRLPAVIMKSEPPPGGAKGGPALPPYQVDVLDFANGVPGGLESSANLFARTCYPGDDWTSPDFARRNGLPAFQDPPEAMIRNPEEIFQVSNQLRGH